MALIPGYASSSGGIVDLQTGANSGIAVSTSAGSATLTSALVAGTNITLTPSPAFGNKGLTISATGSGVASVSAGTNITITGTATNPIVNNNGVLSLTAGSNITLGGTANNPIINAVVPTPITPTQTFQNLAPGSIPQVSLTSNNTNPVSANVPIPALGGATAIPTTAGGIYTLQGSVYLSCSGAGVATQVFLNNGVNDLYIINAPSDFYTSAPFNAMPYYFSITFYATGSSVNLTLGLGAVAGNTAQVLFSPLTLQRVF